MCEKKVFERFNQYDWNKDKEFESGYQAIMNTIQVEDENMRLLKAKHFYFSKFQQPFDLDTYLKYEQEKQESFEAVDSYDYENDSLFMDGLSHIIQSWLEKQSEGLWEKDRLELELKKAKALYYHTKIQTFDIGAYFKRDTNKKSNQPTCPFANLWQNKGTEHRVDQVNSVRFAVTKKQKHKGAFEITLSSPTTKNIISIDRLHELQEAYQEGNQEDVTCLFLKTTVHDTFQTAETIQTRDTKILSSGLAYQETSHMTSDEQSMYELSKAYYDLVKQELLKPPKPIVSFSNGQIPLDASYLFLVPTSFRLITEHAMMDFKLELSHAPIPPLSLFKICRLSIEFKVYLALAPTKLRGPELLFLGLADVFVPEAQLSEALQMAQLLSVSSDPRAVQLALSTRHAYAGPNRLSVWQDQIELVFKTDSIEDIKSRLKSIDNQWSNLILEHWAKLPPTLLNVVFRAVKQSETLTFEEILDLERDLNAKWRQTEDYKQWLVSKDQWETENEEFYFQTLKLPSEKQTVVYEIQEPSAPLVCPVTGQAGLSCPSINV